MTLKQLLRMTDYSSAALIDSDPFAEPCCVDPFIKIVLRYTNIATAVQKYGRKCRIINVRRFGKIEFG